MPRRIHLDRLSKRQRVRAGRKKESVRAVAAYRKSRNAQYTL